MSFQFCSKAGSMHPSSPFLSSLSSPFHLYIRTLHWLIHHPCSWSALDLFHVILPSITSLNNPSPLSMCPIQFFCLLYTVVIKHLFSFTLLSTSSFLIFCSQFIFSSLLHIHISNACNLSFSASIGLHHNIHLSVIDFIKSFVRLQNWIFLELWFKSLALALRLKSLALALALELKSLITSLIKGDLSWRIWRLL